jgi:hypothetical protein
MVTLLNAPVVVVILVQVRRPAPEVKAPEPESVIAPQVKAEDPRVSDEPEKPDMVTVPVPLTTTDGAVIAKDPIVQLSVANAAKGYEASAV